MLDTAESDEQVIAIPNEWNPRKYQLPPLQAFEQGKRRQFLVWHRRAGKDSFGLNLTAIQTQLDVGTYWHLFPEQTHARRAIWHGISNGKRIIDRVFPEAIRKTTRQQEMMIELKSGSIWQMAGSDRYDSLVGSNVKGVVFSEWALCDPTAWDYIRPILRENNGWAVFITTFRGRNHAYQMYQRLKNNPEWFCSMLTVDDTKREDGSPVFSKADIDAERAEGMTEALIQQEYYCSPVAAFAGAYYQTEMADLRRTRMVPIEWEPALNVTACFDLGMNDLTTCAFIQESGNQARIIGSRAWRMTSIPKICEDIRQTFPWPVHNVILPHDGAVHDMGTGDTRRETFEQCMPKTTVEICDAQGRLKGRTEGIEATRQWLPKVWIDNAVRPWTAGQENNFTLTEALTSYRTEEAKGDVFQLQPLHSWESHWADMIRYFAVHRRSGTIGRGWTTSVDYSAQDRAVI